MNNAFLKCALLPLLLGTFSEIGMTQRMTAQSPECIDWSQTFFLFDTTRASGCHELLSFEVGSKGIVHRNALYTTQDGFLQEWMNLPPFPRERFYHKASEAGLIAEGTFVIPSDVVADQRNVNLMVQAHLTTVLDSAVKLDEVLLTVEITPQNEGAVGSVNQRYTITKGELIGSSRSPLMMYRTPTWRLMLPGKGVSGAGYYLRLYWSGRERIALRSVRVFSDETREDRP